MPLPTVSVVIPCHNAAPFLEEAVGSALGQEGVRPEVIVVDDASTDGSREVAGEYGGRIVLAGLERNRGASHARNVGASLATGDSLLFLDADDVLGPGALAALARALRGRPGDAAACPWGFLRRVRGRWTPLPADHPLPDPDADPLREWLAGRWVPTCALLWGREAYERSGGWHEEVSFNDDGDVAMRALARGVRLVRAEEGMAFYRRHGSSRLSASGDVFSEGKLRSAVRVLEKLSAVLEEEGRPEEYREPIGVVYHRLALLAFREGHTALGRECLQRGVEGAGPRAVSRTLGGRVLDRLLGVERKERVAGALARVGLATAPRREAARLRRRQRAGVAGGAG